MLKLSPVFRKNAAALKDDFRYIINQGGTSSTKTFSILQLLVTLSLKYKVKIDIVGLSVPHLKTGVLNDMPDVCNQFGIDFYKHYKSSDKIFQAGKGIITFLSFDKLGSAHGGRRDFLYLNEANHQHYNIVEQLLVRTRKNIFIDYNPTNEFWVHEKIFKDEPEKATLIKSTYKDNPFLEQTIIDSIEARKGDNNFWRVYGLGELGIAEGLVFENFEVADFDKNRFSKYRYGIDWGFSCLKSDTLVSTDKGNIPIKDIKIGDNVLTREGYKKVLFTQNKGIKEVYSIDFGYGNSIIATGDHIIFTYDGWKRVDELRGVAKLCVMKSNLMAEFIKGIQRGNIQTISTIKQKLKAEFTIEMCGNIIMELFQKAMLFITLILTHLIMILVILFVSLPLNILKYIINIIWVQYQKKECNKSEQKMDIRKKTGKKEEKNQSKQFKKKEEYVKNVVNLLQLPMFIKNTVHRIVEKEQIQELAKKNIFVNTVVNTLCLLLTMKEKHVQQNVPIKLTLLKDKAEVFDITVENGEFFANGILVHNCDPFAFVECAIEQNRLYICNEIYQTKLLNKESSELVKKYVRNERIICDSAEPKSVQEYQSYGLNAVAAKKGKGSVLSGLKYMQQFDKIIIHPSCTNAIAEFKNYQYKRDKNGDFVNDEPVDAFNHLVDAIRYSLEDEMNFNTTRLVGMRPF